MSNQYNDMLADRAIDIVAEKMEKNPTIPEEARNQLEKEEYEKLCEAEPTDYEPEKETEEPQKPAEKLFHARPMTRQQLLQNEANFIDSFTQ